MGFSFKLSMASVTIFRKLNRFQKQNFSFKTIEARWNEMTGSYIQKSSVRNFSEGVAATESSSDLILYSFWQSSCSWRVRFALNLKGLSYEYRAVNLSKGEQHTPEFEKINPLRCVPVLVVGDVVISDSYAILLFLEEKYPQRPLLPPDPRRRAVNLQVASIISSSIQPLHMLSVLKHIEDKFGAEERLLWAHTYLEKGFLALEKLLEDYEGRYTTGEEVYMADVFLAPQVAVATERFKIDMSKFPRLSRIYESLKTLPEFQAASPERQPDAVH